MKKIIVCSLLFSLATIVNSQDQKDKKVNWTLSMHYGLQADDERLFNFLLADDLVQRHPGKFGVQQFGLNVVENIYEKNSFSLHTGVGLSTELNTFTRPFDQMLLFIQNGELPVFWAFC